MISRLLELTAVVLGTFFMAVASIGVLRLPDFYHRIHAPTKAATLGLTFLLAGAALAVRQPEVWTKAVLAILFLAATAPVGAHLLCRAAYRGGVPPSKATVIDEYQGCAGELCHEADDE